MYQIQMPRVPLNVRIPTPPQTNILHRPLNTISKCNVEEDIFNPSTSPPESEFMKRMIERQLCYNKSEKVYMSVKK